MSFAVCAAPAVFWRILRTRPHAVLCIEPTLFSAPAALLAAKLIRARCVLHVQDLEVDAAFAVGPLRARGLQRACLAVERMLLRRFDRIVTISAQMRAALIAKGADARRVEIVRNWVDLKAVSVQPQSARNPFLDELELKPADRVALYAGHLGAKQALTVLLDAARHLERHRDVVVVIAGAGPERERLIEAAAGSPNVRFLPLQPPERFDDLLALADVHVLPQHRAAADLVLPSKLGPMLASGRPIAVTADAGTELADMLSDIAFVVPAGEGEPLADAVLRALSMDVSRRTAKGLALAATLDSERVLAAFADLLTGDVTDRAVSADAAVEEHAAGLTGSADAG